MRFLRKTFKAIKLFIEMPATIKLSQQSLIQIENKIDLLTLKVNDLTMNSTLEKQEKRLSFQELRESEKLPIPNEISEVFENHFLQIESLLSIYNSLPNLKYLPATRGWAGSPDFLNKIIEVILKHKPRFVLEASSGVSSIVIGLALKKNNYGKSLSFEHDISYSKVTQKNINVNEIEDISTVMDCPINDYLIEGETWKWYETEGLTFTDKIDLLIIDGPPRTTQNLARYPAIPILHKHFSDNIIILLDDAKRPDEIVILEKWIVFLKKHNYHVTFTQFNNYEKGMVILEVNRILSSY